VTFARPVIVVATLAGAGVALATCDDGAGPLTPAGGTTELLVSLLSPNADGGLLLTLTGPSLPEPVPEPGFWRFFTRRVSDTEIRMVIFGSISAGPLFSLTVPDAAATSEYGATIIEVSGQDDQVRSNLNGYALRFEIQTAGR
jgi:hypothetical protein